MLRKQYKRLTRLQWCILLLFVVLSLVLLINHEPWRDEAQAWLIARDNSIPSIIGLMGYEGTPALWHFLLLPLAKLGVPYVSMSILHFLLMLSAVIIFVHRSPFSKFQKILFVFGYYIFYEYNIVARSYVLSVLCLFLIASVYRKRFTKPIWYSALLFLLANTNVHSLVIALVLSTFYIYELKFGSFTLNSQNRVGIFIILLGVAIAVYQLLPPSDLWADLITWDFNLEYRKLDIINNAMVNAFLPIPHIKLQFWHTKLSFPRFYQGLIALLLFISSAILIRKRTPLLIYLTSIIGLLAIFIFKYEGDLRHHGLIFIIYIASLWISWKDADVQHHNRFLPRLFTHKRQNVIFTAFLIFQIIASPVAFYYDFNFDFSASKRTAMLLNDRELINRQILITTYRSPVAMSIFPYLPEAQFYSLEFQEFRTFGIWNKKYASNRRLKGAAIMDRIDNALQATNYSKVVLILSKEGHNSLKNDKAFLQRYSLMESYSGSITSESFFIYRLNDRN